MLQLRCRNCNDVIDIKDEIKTCSCGRYSVQLKYKKDLLVQSDLKYLSGYTIMYNDNEYLLLSKKELEV